MNYEHIYIQKRSLRIAGDGGGGLESDGGLISKKLFLTGKFCALTPFILNNASRFTSFINLIIALHTVQIHSPIPIFFMKLM